MNGRAPEYKRVNEQTLVKKINGKTRFVTFWKNVHQQFLISEGIIDGLTYTVESSRVVNREEGNAFWYECKKAGWTKWTDPNNTLGTVLF